MPVGDIQMSCWVMSWRSWAETTPRYCRISQSAFLLGCSRTFSRPTVGGEHRQWITQTPTTLAIIIYSHQNTLKYVDSCCVLLLSAYSRRDCVRRFESRVTTYKMLALNSSRPTFFVADMVIPFGRYGLFVWPMWSWPIWFVVDMVQTLTSLSLSSSLIFIHVS